jgi:hypothetical protein
MICARIMGVFAMLGRGAAHHFALRVSDWFAGSVMLSFGVALIAWPSILHTFAYYRLLSRILPDCFWGYVCLTIGIGRVTALTINGTFPLFRWSPQLRLAMASMSSFIWFQIALGLLVSDQPTAMIAVYPQLFLFDMYNVFLAASEAGVSERLHYHVGG